jgi:hypothetical protein
MYEQLSKQEFIERTKKEIAVSEDMLKWVDEHYWPIVKKFDGKVFNKRFFNALYETVDTPVVFRHTNSARIDVEGIDYAYEQEIEFSYNADGIQKRMFLTVVTNIEGRVVAADSHTKNYDRNIKTFKSNMKDYHDSIERYDEIKAFAEDLEKKIREYAEMPFTARRNMAGFSKWYLG